MSLEDPELSRRLQAAASLLVDEAPGPVDAEAATLLSALGYRIGEGQCRPATDPGQDRHRASLLRTAAGLHRLFQLQSPDAPGAIFFGGEVEGPEQTGSVSGVGLSLRAAFESCIGEAVEYRSQFEDHHHRVEPAGILDAPDTMPPLHRAWLDGILAHRRSNLGEPAWCAAKRLSDGALVAFPADICLRRGPGQRVIEPPYPLSIGCAAGASLEAATLHGLLELVERDAASLWWRGAKPGRSLTLEEPAQSDAIQLIRQLRLGRDRRSTWLLDITSDLGIPCVAAASCLPDGAGFACGVAARLDLTAAAHSALLELCQMELAHSLVATKRAYRGDGALNEIDRRHLRRATAFNAFDCPLLHPRPRATAALEVLSAVDPLVLIAARLASFNIEIFVIDLTHPDLGIPVVRVLAPGLQPEPSAIDTQRLKDAISATGGGVRYTNGIELM